MALGVSVSIGGASFPIRPNSLSIAETLGQVELATLDVDDRHGTLQPHLFDAVVIEDGLTTIFQGDVDSMELRSMESPYKKKADGTFSANPVGARIWNIQAAGLSYLARRNVTGAFSAQARIAISTVVGALAAGMGIATSIGTNPSGLVLANSFLSEQETLADAFHRLADIATYLSGVTHVWMVRFPSGTPTFVFQPVTSLGASGGLGVGGYKVRSGSIRYRTSREQFANSVVLKLDRYLKDGGDTQTDSFVGSDIFLTTLTLTSPAASQPEIKVNGTVETVGIKDVDTSKDWYWVLGSTILTVGDSGASGSDTIDVTYAAHDLRAVTVSNSSSIAAVGLVRVPVSAGDTGNVSSPLEQAGSELTRRLGAIEHVTLVADVPSSAGFAPGQLVSITLSGFGSTGVTSLSGDFVIQSVRTFDEDSVQLWREFELIRGPLPYRASRFMSRFVR